MEDVSMRLCWFFGTVQESCRLTRDRREEKPARIVVEHSRESRGAHGLGVSCPDHKH
jgi:hypothetical protein